MYSFCPTDFWDIKMLCQVIKTSIEFLKTEQLEFCWMVGFGCNSHVCHNNMCQLVVAGWKIFLDLITGVMMIKPCSSFLSWFSWHWELEYNPLVFIVITPWCLLQGDSSMHLLKWHRCEDASSKFRASSSYLGVWPSNINKTSLPDITLYHYYKNCPITWGLIHKGVACA
jgi:hypothetical protein